METKRINLSKLGKVLSDNEMKKVRGGCGNGCCEMNLSGTNGYCKGSISHACTKDSDCWSDGCY